jgi:hypothetical protein
MDAKTAYGDYDAEKPRCGIDPGLSGQVHRGRESVVRRPGHRFRNGVSSCTDAMNHKCSFGFFANSHLGKLNHVTVTCNRWTCKCCRKQLIRGWAAHFSDCTGNLPTVYRHTVERRDWKNLYERLRRRGIRYIAVDVGHTRKAVYTDSPLDNSHPLSPSDAAAAFHRELNSYIHEPKKHPVSTCREWKRPKKPSKYNRIPDVPPVKAEHVRTAAEQLGIVLKPWTSEDASGLEVLAKREDAIGLILLSETMAGASKRGKQSIQQESVVLGDRLIPYRGVGESRIPVVRRPAMSSVSCLERDLEGE